MHTPNKAALLIGFGMGGFFDLMILHLVLQWHHMIPNRVPPNTLEALQRNIYWDGVGQTAMWLLTLIGVLMLFNAIRQGRSFPTMLQFVGWLIMGWGVFNFLDGVLNHHILALHNVREDVVNQQTWNLGFMLVGGIALPFFGWVLTRRGSSAR